VVEERQWMDDQEFAEILTLCQLMPGPNIVGIAVCVGARLRGATGALTAWQASFSCPGCSGCH